MTEQKQKTKKISRRDAIKLLGAVTGATVLANLPTKWNTPEIASGVLPAHAQTSTTLFTATCGPFSDIEPDTDQLTFSILIDPPVSGIIMRWSISFTNAEYDNPLSPTSGTVATVNGTATLLTDSITSTFGQGSVDVFWGFDNPANGQFPVCTQSVAWGLV